MGMPHSRYNLRAKAGGHELIIYGDIGDSWDAEQSNDAKTVVSEMQGLEGSLTVRINSYGGVVADGLAIHNAIRRFKGRTTVEIDGVAFSIASLIAMAADTVRMADNALLMIHAPWGMAIGNANDMREAADHLDTTAAAMVRGYLRDDGPNEGQVAEWLNDGADHYFTAEEAYGMGLVDEVTGSVDIAAALRASAPRFQPPVNPGTTKGAEMPKPEDTSGSQTGAPDYVEQHNAAVKAGVDKGVKAENARQRTIRAAFDGLIGDDPTDPMRALCDACIADTACDEVEANRRILAALKHRTDVPIPSLAAAGEQSPAGGAYAHSAPARVGGAYAGQDATDKLVEGATRALLIREGLEHDQEAIKAERTSEFLSMSLSEIAKVCAHHAGIPTHGTREQVIRRVLAAGPGQGTSHFPAILENIANKGVMDGFMNAEETWQDWTVPGTLQDYRQATRVNKSLFTLLDKMYEGEEFTHGKFADVKQNIQGYLYGKEFSLTLQSMVNDDLGLLVDDTQAWGEAANTTVGDAVFTVLTASGTGGYGQSMTEDSTILFHADHSNYVASGSGGAPADATISAGRTAMMTQTDPNSRTVAARPRYLLHGTALTTAVFTLLNSQYNITGAASTLGELNAVRSLGLTGVEEYRFDSFVSTAWIMAAARRTVEVAFVGGQRTPIVDRQAVSNVPGVSWQISLPFGVAALDYRTLYLNYGA